MTNRQSPIVQRQPRCRGLSLIEMLVSLAIMAALLTATMVAIDVSFKAYAIAAESASTQTATRMVVNRLLTLVRTSTAHGPMLADADEGVSVAGNIVSSPYLELIDPDGNLVTITYDDTTQQLNLTKTPASGGTTISQPIIGGVTACSFTISRRRDNDDVWVMDRASIDFTVQPDDDASLDLEVGQVPPVRVIASTKPRRLN